MAIKGIVFNIQRFSINDGPGIRTTVFLKGCALGCRWCQNPEGKSGEIEILNGKKIGKAYSPEELMQVILKDTPFYDQSGGGVTFSGGDPLYQPEFLAEMLSICRSEGIHTAVDTSGFAEFSTINKLIGLTDLFLYDLKLMNPAKHLEYTGVTNTEILKNLTVLLSRNASVNIRIPLISGITTLKENIFSIIEFLKGFSMKPLISLLPYHNLAKAKYLRYKLDYTLNLISELTLEELDEISGAFTEAGYRVQTGN
jgi:pyruvate formate lyase activating enzyme